MDVVVDVVVDVDVDVEVDVVVDVDVDRITHSILLKPKTGMCKIARLGVWQYNGNVVAIVWMPTLCAMVGDREQVSVTRGGTKRRQKEGDCGGEMRLPWQESTHSYLLGGTYTKIGTIQRRLAWPLRKDDTQNREAFHIFLRLLLSHHRPHSSHPDQT